MGSADGCDVGFEDVGSAVIDAGEGLGVGTGVGVENGAKLAVLLITEVGFAVGSMVGMSTRCCCCAAMSAAHKSNP